MSCVKENSVAFHLNSGRRVYKAPKSEAGKRTVAVPASIMPALVLRLDL